MLGVFLIYYDAKIFLFLVLIYTSLLNAQQYSGKVVNSKSGEIIPYVNIGIVNKGVGTVSLGDGSFHLNLEAEYDNDTLRFSMIGLESVSYLVKDYKTQFNETSAEILMAESLTELQTVIIKPVKVISVIKGNTFDNKSFAAGWKSDDLGGELGTIINVKKAQPIL